MSDIGDLKVHADFLTTSHKVNLLLPVMLDVMPPCSMYL
jgi:hypothetical protein